MFLFRSRRVGLTIVSEDVRISSSLDHYATLILITPACIPKLSQAARDRLAFGDQQSVILIHEERETLLCDCLYRRFCIHTELGYYHALCIEVAKLASSPLASCPTTAVRIRSSLQLRTL